MKARAYILILIWTILLIEPVTANLDIETVYSSCAQQSGCSIQQMTESSCTKSKSDPDTNEDEQDCEGNRCNPLMSCPTGNFYLFNHSSIAIDVLIVSKQKKALIDDNRISKHLAECWHPPEMI